MSPCALAIARHGGQSGRSVIRARAQQACGFQPGGSKGTLMHEVQHSTQADKVLNIRQQEAGWSWWVVPSGGVLHDGRDTTKQGDVKEEKHGTQQPVAQHHLRELLNREIW